MKELNKLKEELLAGKLNNLYIFHGPENHIRQVYIKKIIEISKDSIYKYVETVADVYKDLLQRRITTKKTIYHVFNDMDYLKQKEEMQLKLLPRIKENIVILSYTDASSSGLFSVYEKNTTYFGKVTSEIVHGFVQDRLHCNEQTAELIAYDCFWDYEKMLLEISKIKNTNIEDPNNSYKWLLDKGQFQIRQEDYEPKLLADAILTGNKNELRYASFIFRKLKLDILYYLPSIIDAITIALFIKSYGAFPGSTKAYEAGLYWGWVKEIRNYGIIYSEQALRTLLGQLNDVDSMIRKGQLSRESGLDYILTTIL